MSNKFRCNCPAHAEVFFPLMTGSDWGWHSFRPPGPPGSKRDPFAPPQPGTVSALGGHQWDIGTTSILAQLAPSKDSYWSRPRQPGRAYGAVVEPHLKLQSAVLSFSAGPVAVSDMIRGLRPSADHEGLRRQRPAAQPGPAGNTGASGGGGGVAAAAAAQEAAASSSSSSRQQQAGLSAASSGPSAAVPFQLCIPPSLALSDTAITRIISIITIPITVMVLMIIRINNIIIIVVLTAINQAPY